MGGSNPLGEIIEQMMRQGRPRPSEATKYPSSPRGLSTGM
jgi:hypothetical protein